MARCNCSPRCSVCGDGPCDCTCTEAEKAAHLAQPSQAVDAVSELQRKAFAFDAMVAAGRISKNLAEQSIALSDGPIESHQAATIRAELTRLYAIADSVDPLVVRLGEVTAELERLREQVAQSHRDLMDERYSVQAHLSEPRT